MAKKSKASGVVAQAHRICNIVPSRNTERDWPFAVAVESTAVKAVAAPSGSVDLRGVVEHR